MCLLCDYTGKKICEHRDEINTTEYSINMDRLHKELQRIFSNAFFLGEMDGGYFIHGPRKSEADVLLEQQEDKPKPGTGVTITDGRDQNHQRDGFVRGYEGEYYNIFFEPGDKDGKYKRDQFETNDHSIDPKKISDPTK